MLAHFFLENYRKNLIKICSFYLQKKFQHVFINVTDNCKKERSIKQYFLFLHTP